MKLAMKVLSVSMWLLAGCLCCLSSPGRSDSGLSDLSAPSAEIQAELNKAAAAGSADPGATEHYLASFRALRDRYPGSLFVQERYQDTVQTYGIEGQLKSLTEEYNALDRQPDGDRQYHYLYLRSLVGYSTGAAIQGLTEMVIQNPNYAPAHETLAEIYGSASFRDPDKETLERQTFLRLCPGGTLASLPSPLPEPSPLIDQAESLLAKQSDSDRIIALTVEGLNRQEWRWQRIHPHDWYSDDYKRQTLLALRDAYWKSWSIQVRCYRRAGQLEQAADLLARMDKSAITFLNSPNRRYWNALSTLVQLYAEGNQKQQATQTLELMKTLLAKSPEANAAAEIKTLEMLVSAS